MSGSPSASSPILSRLKGSLAGLRPYRTPATPPPIKLDANESPFRLPPAARKALAEHLSGLDFQRYPDGRAGELRRVLCARLDCTADELMLGVGSDEVIAIVLGAFATPGAKVLYPTPTFVMYGHTARAQGYTPVEVPLAEGFHLDLPAMHAALEEHRPALAFYATPNNPTGNSFAEHALRELIEAHPTTLHVIDEAYGAFHRTSPEAAPRWRHAWTQEYDNTLALGTLSKIGLAGLRVGWCRGNEGLIYELEKVRQPFNLSHLTIASAAFVLEHYEALLEAQLQEVCEQRQVLRQHLEDRGYAPLPSDSNFLLVPIDDAATVRDALREKGVAIRAFSEQRLAHYARVSVGSAEECEAFLKALDDITRPG